MACIDMFNPDHPTPPTMSPRISFSCDFVDVEPPTARSAHVPPPDPNFEFSVGSRPMIAADQLFFKGRLLPLQDSCRPPAAGSHGSAVTTLRDELRAGDAAGGQLRERPPKGSIKWKELLGLKKPRGTAARKNDKNEGGSGAAEAHLGKSMQEL